MKKLITSIAILACLSMPAYAARKTATITTTTDAPEISRITPEDRDRFGNKYEATISMQGTFAGNTIHLLKSVDGGTTKIPVNDLTGAAYTKTSAGDVDISHGFPSSLDSAPDQSVIFYASVGGDSPGAPTLTITVDDNR